MKIIQTQNKLRIAAQNQCIEQFPSREDTPDQNFVGAEAEDFLQLQALKRKNKDKKAWSEAVDPIDMANVMEIRDRCRELWP